MKHSLLGMCGVGKFMWKWKQRDSAACPRCGQFKDAQHVWVCEGGNSQEIWDTSLDWLRCWMISVDMDPDLQHHILQHLFSRRDASNTTSYAPPLVQEALWDQDAIGWDWFLEGWVCAKWQVLQHRHYSCIRSAWSGKCWVVALISKLWDKTWDLWDHRNGILHDQVNIFSQDQQQLILWDASWLYNELQACH